MMRQKMDFPLMSRQKTLTNTDVSPVLRMPYIMSGYRRPYQSNWYYAMSFFNLHNESLNIWSHFIAILILLYKLAQTTKHVDYFNDPNSFAIFPFAFGALECAFFSTLAHLMHSRSEFHHFRYFQLDYLGVIMNAQGIGIMYFFFSGTETFYNHWGSWLVPIIHASICVCGFAAMCAAKIHCYPESLLRITLMVGQALISCMFSGLPVWYKFWEVLFALDIEQFWVEVFPLLSHYLLFGISGIFYAARVPEKLAPGKCDIVGHGHQIFHVILAFISWVQFNHIVDFYGRRPQRLTSLANPGVCTTIVLHFIVVGANMCIIICTKNYCKTRAREEIDKHKSEKGTH